RRTGVVAEIGETPRQIANVIDQAERLLDHDEPGVIARLVRCCEIGGDLAAAARQRDDSALDAAGVGDDTGYIRHGGSSSEWSSIIAIRPAHAIAKADSGVLQPRWNSIAADCCRSWPPPGWPPTPRRRQPRRSNGPAAASAPG